MRRVEQSGIRSYQISRLHRDIDRIGMICEHRGVQIFQSLYGCSMSIRENIMEIDTTAMASRNDPETPVGFGRICEICLLYTSPSPRD